MEIRNCERRKLYFFPLSIHNKTFLLLMRSVTYPMEMGLGNIVNSGFASGLFDKKKLKSSFIFSHPGFYVYICDTFIPRLEWSNYLAYMKPLKN